MASLREYNWPPTQTSGKTGGVNLASHQSIKSLESPVTKDVDKSSSPDERSAVFPSTLIYMTKRVHLTGSTSLTKQVWSRTNRIHVQFNVLNWSTYWTVDDGRKKGCSCRHAKGNKFLWYVNAAMIFNHYFYILLQLPLSQLSWYLSITSS